MINQQAITTIQEQYPWTSWALWDAEFPDDGCIEQTPSKVADFIHERSDQLTADVVLTGLNRSADLEAPFMNFHNASGRHYDWRLKEFIQDGRLTNLSGAYMTDLVDDINPDASEVEMSDADARVFLDQLRLLGENEYHVICFGNKPFDALTGYLGTDSVQKSPEIKYSNTTSDGFTFHIYRVWFYGLYGANQDKVDILERQLQHLNQRILD
jgi:hypothetical protein